MKLLAPFFISSRLAPAIKLADGELSYNSGKFTLETPTFTHSWQAGFPRCRVRGATDANVLQDAFRAQCSFLSACAESRAYAERQGKDASEGENSDLFPSEVGEWAQANSGEIDMMGFELSESPGLLAM